jgi:hypothetical protein
LGEIATINHVAPRTGNASDTGGQEGPAGFTLFRSPTTVQNTPTNPITVTGSQDTATPTPFLVRGFGLENSSFQEKGIIAGAPLTQVDWDARLLLATGTWVASAEPTLLGGSVNVFSGPTGGSTAAATTNLVVIPAIPEPSTFALAGLALLGLIGYARRK